MTAAIRPPRHLASTLALVFAAACVILGAGPSPAQETAQKAAQETIGTVSRLQGEATASGDTRVRLLTAGAPVAVNEVLETGPDARLEITFRDDSVLTLGAEARLVVDRLVFDPEIQDGGAVGQSIQVLAGNFRFLSGAIGKADPGSVRVSTPVATIGIRGTDFLGGPDRSGESDGAPRYGVLLIDGAVQVLGRDGAVVLDAPREGTFLAADGTGAPSEPRVWSEAAQRAALAAVAFDGQ